MISIPNLIVDKVLIAYGLRRNASIIYINLNMNPLGRNGAQALLRHQVIITALQYLLFTWTGPAPQLILFPSCHNLNHESIDVILR